MRGTTLKFGELEAAAQLRLRQQAKHQKQQEQQGAQQRWGELQQHVLEQLAADDLAATVAALTDIQEHSQYRNPYTARHGQGQAAGVEMQEQSRYYKPARQQRAAEEAQQVAVEQAQQEAQQEEPGDDVMELIEFSWLERQWRQEQAPLRSAASSAVGGRRQLAAAAYGGGSSGRWFDGAAGSTPGCWRVAAKCWAFSMARHWGGDAAVLKLQRWIL